MSKIHRAFTVLLALAALTVLTPGHAETPTQEGQREIGVVRQVFTGATQQVSDTLDSVINRLTTPFITFNFTSKDEDCLARNIYYEAGGESEEGKAAVGIVTINRVKDGRFARTICEVVHQRTVFVRHKEVAKTEMVAKGFFGRPEPVTKKELVVQSVPVCQFSWACAFVRIPKVTDERWEDSKRIAKALLNEEYPTWTTKYQNAIYFHSTGVRPPWASQKIRVNKIGGHIFYEEKTVYSSL
jgi:spore germination cell wall hydrolase CwlJ-like protein